jgi:hypothetical protein
MIPSGQHNKNHLSRRQSTLSLSAWSITGSCLSRSLNQTHEIDRKNQMDQIPATSAKWFRDILSFLATSAEVIMLVEHRLTEVSGGRNIRA